MIKCTNCNKNYNIHLGQELELCTPCTDLVLDTKEKLLKDVKPALHSNVYYNKLKLITKQRKQLRDEYKQ